MRERKLRRALRAALLIGATTSTTATLASGPVIYTRADLERGGYLSLGDVLERLPYAGGTTNPRYNSGGDGTHLIDLRNLGATRTLVLVNGKRWIRTLQGTVDLSSIPLSAMERVEVYLEGTSASMQSGGIAGAVNIVLRESFDGPQAGALLSENAHGDGRMQHYDVTLGSVGERASVMLSASYAKQDSISAGDRAISAVPLFGFDANDVNVGASSTTPYGHFGVAGAPGTVTLIPGRTGTNVIDFRPFDLATDGYNFAPDQLLQTPQERVSLFASARYDIADALSFQSTVIYNERRSAQQFAPLPLVLGTVAGGPGRFSIPANNVFNPFGVDVTRAQFRNTLQPRRFEQDVDTFRFDGVLDGGFALFERAWRWQVGYAYTDSEEVARSIGLFDLTRLRAGLGSSFRDAGGVARCGAPGVVIDNCVPINLFGGPNGFTREMLDFVSFTAHDSRYIEQHAYTANLSGELFELPAGPATMTLGYAHHREFGFDQPDALVASGTTSDVVRQETRGDFSIDETYVEFNLPLLREMGLMHRLDLHAGTRFVDHANGSRNEPNLALRWQPFESLMLQAAYAESSRAPSIQELFQDTSDTFPAVLDVCAASAQSSPTVLQRCRNGFGGITPVPIGFEPNNGGGPVVEQGGNSTLDSESGATRSLGFHWTPTMLANLQLALNWHQTRVRDEIGIRFGQSVLEDCYVRGNIDACSHIQRAPDGNLLRLFAGNFNLPGGTEVEGYDFEVSYDLDTEFGRFDFAWQTAYTSYFGPIDQPRGGNRVGVYDGPGLAHHRIKSHVVTQWQHGDWSAAATARYLSGLDERCFLPVVLDRPELCSDPSAHDPQLAPFGGGVNHLAGTWYFDLEGSWDTPWHGRISVGMRNVFDRDPPVSFTTSANNFDPGYEVPGRFWFLGYQQRF